MRRVRSWLSRPSVRHREAWGLALLGVCAAGSQHSAEAQDEGQPIHLSLDADKIRANYGDDQGTVDLEGGVELRATNVPGSYSSFEINTERVNIGLAIGEISAPRGATFRTPGIEVTGESIYYNFRRQDFRAEEARSRLSLWEDGPAIYARSERMEAKEHEITLQRSLVTTCDREHPHYGVKVGRITANTDTGKASLRSGKAYLYGVNIPIFPKISGEIGPDGAETSLVFPAYSSREGFYAPFSRNITAPEEPLWIRLDGRVTQKYFLAGRADVQHRRGNTKAWLTAARRMSIKDDINDYLVLNSIPEAGVEWARESGDSQVTVRLFGGSYRDQNVRTNVRHEGEGGTLRVDWDWLRDRPEDPTSLWAGMGARGSLYSTGTSYRTVDFRVGASTPLWRDARGRLELRHNIIGGATPFEFDDVDIPTEAYAAISTPIAGPWSAAFSGRYDLDLTSVRDYTAEVSYRHHCLTWSLSYRNVGSQIGIGVDLLGMDHEGPAAPKRRRERRTIPGGALVAQAPGPAATSPGAEPEPEPVVELSPEKPPTEFDLAENVHERAPGTEDPFRRRPPPSTRLAYAQGVQ